jgi:hypothetical protein
MPCISALFWQNGEQKNPNNSMHCGQIGLLQTVHFSVVGTPRCFEQNFEAGAASSADAGAAGFSACEIFKRGAGVGSGGGGAETGEVYSGAGAPNSFRTISFTNSDESRPHVGQTKVTGFCTISGRRSKAYFAPQGHCSFMF